MPNSQPRSQRGYPQPQQYPSYGAPPMAQQQMHPSQMHEGYNHPPHPGYPPNSGPGYAPQGPPPPHYHPHGPYPPFAYPPGYSPPFYPPAGSSPPQYPYPPQQHPAQMNIPVNNRQHENKNPSSPKAERSPPKSDRKKNEESSIDSLVKASSPKSSNATATEEMDDMTSRVNPMRSDFHFYAEEHKKEALDSIDADNTSPLEKIAVLNEKLLNMWEKENSSTRTEYMMKEEADRSRFMNEDEIESRHCATLTSRPKPYAQIKGESKADVVTKVVTKDEEDEDDEEKLSGSKRRGKDGAGNKNDNHESPTKKIKDDIKTVEGGDTEKKES